MKHKRLILIASASLLLASMLLPLWRIEIYAPQYPEGLVMQIGVSAISGNIDQINILNHYIGMKAIIPAEIPELRIVPPSLIAVALLGFLAALVNRSLLSQAWFGLLALGASIGLLDMYLWGYDYGHNLSPNAPIKVPGMTYQPPLIGHKTLLNIDSYSLPDWGGYVLAIAITLAFIAAFGDILSRKLAKISQNRESDR